MVADELYTRSIVGEVCGVLFDVKWCVCDQALRSWCENEHL